MPPRKGWAAVYCRLSKEDEDKAAAESESIRNQRALLLDWAATHGYHVYKVYTDEDYSGIDRARPGFNAMLNDARQGKFEVILAKTQSRFTRDMELVERYLHGLFPEWGVRFIAVLDHVDTCDPAGKKARQINGLINEWYLEDLSGNVRAVLDHKRHSGCYIASFALYGYRKDPADHNRLVIDPPAAAVVRRIFALYVQGAGAGKIAQTLNAEAIPPPSVYRAAQSGQPAAKPTLWSKATVRRILSNSTYVGDMEQGRVRKLNYKKGHPAAPRRVDHRTGHSRGHHQPTALCGRAKAAGSPQPCRTRRNTTPTGGACPVRYVRRKDGTDRQRPAPLLPLLHSGQEPRGLSGAAISAHARLRKAGAVQTANLYTPAADLCPGARPDTNDCRQSARKRPAHDKNNLALLTAV